MAWFFHLRFSKARRPLAGASENGWPCWALPAALGRSAQTVIWRLQLSSNYPQPLSDSIRKVKLGLFPTPNLPLNKNRKLKRKRAWLQPPSVFERHRWGRWAWRIGSGRACGQPQELGFRGKGAKSSKKGSRTRVLIQRVLLFYGCSDKTLSSLSRLTRHTLFKGQKPTGPACFQQSEVSPVRWGWPQVWCDTGQCPLSKRVCVTLFW